jgi:hypothetical protein
MTFVVEDAPSTGVIPAEAGIQVTAPYKHGAWAMHTRIDKL